MNITYVYTLYICIEHGLSKLEKYKTILILIDYIELFLKRVE